MTNLIGPTEAAAGKPQRGIQALDASAQLIGALLRAGSPLALSELARLAGMVPAKAFPHLVSLVRAGVLQRDADGRFLPGPLALQLGLIALQRLSPVREAEPEVRGVAVDTGLSVAMAVLGPLGPTVVRLEESARPQHVSLRVGTVLSLVNTAIGRVFAAHQPADVLDGLLQQETVRMAGAPVKGLREEKTAYAARLARIREQGMDDALDRPVPGIHTLAVPVFDHTGTVVLVLAAMGTAGSFDSGLDGNVARRLAGAAQRLSWRFGRPRSTAQDDIPREP
ncbi:IclR family transcriptional regulator [Cupriavidus gilardii]|uniref:IclR family transcriptional regulator n=1 Tax=Cupriavidus gilardii TaxID=82541 RepID=UPI0021B1D61E|nr:IclR family transcriptional regulator [Cupriavidus gilardii]UXC37730.1 IclR family transcriptional regulator [Cupriavidus gilardii]